VKAVVMAGGQGTRLRPLTSNQPKPMLPVVNRPLMEHIVKLLKEHSFSESVVTIQFLGSLIRSYFGNGEDLGVYLRHAPSETPLGTAGSVKNAEDELRDDTFLVISGDALTDIDLTDLVRFHREKGGIATICLKAVENPLEFGIVITREDGSIERFLEKPNWGQVFSDTINTGIYVLEPEIFDYIPEETVFDFSQDLFPTLLDKGLPIFGYVAEGYWCDVGNFDTYLLSHRDVLSGQANVQIPGFALGDGIWLGEGAEVDPAAHIEGPVVIGENCRVEAGARIREFTVLGNNASINIGANVGQVFTISYTAVGGNQGQNSYMVTQYSVPVYVSGSPPPQGMVLNSTVSCNPPPAPSGDCMGSISLCSNANQQPSYQPGALNNELNSGNAGCMIG
jgi:mannose-1-phosphate guanylyltransferase / phosphomannomutase